MWLIIGLGNPGPQYEITRHNIGFLAIDAFLASLNLSPRGKSNFNALISSSTVEDQSFVTAKPQTFMNRSGTPVQALMAFHKIDLDHIVVIHDELDLPLGSIRIKRGGGSNGHNGLKDITRLLGPDYIRIRLGVGRPTFKGSEADYLLSPFHKTEMATVNEICTHTARMIKALLTTDLENVQQLYQINAQKNA